MENREWENAVSLQVKKQPAGIYHSTFPIPYSLFLVFPDPHLGSAGSSRPPSGSQDPDEDSDKYENTETAHRIPTLLHSFSMQRFDNTSIPAARAFSSA